MVPFPHQVQIDCTTPTRKRQATEATVFARVYPKFLGDLASNHCHPELQQDRNEVEVLRR